MGLGPQPRDQELELNPNMRHKEGTLSSALCFCLVLTSALNSEKERNSVNGRRWIFAVYPRMHAQLPPQSPPQEGGMLWGDELELIHLAIPTLLPSNAQPTLSALLTALDDF